jgi:hypothetical protein
MMLEFNSDLVDILHISNVSHVYVIIKQRPYSSIRVVYSCILPLSFSMVLLEQVLFSSSYANFWNLLETDTSSLLQALKGDYTSSDLNLS